MANYIFAVASTDYIRVKNPEEVSNVFLTAGFEESYVNNGQIFIGSYETSVSDEIVVCIDKTTKKPVAVITYDDPIGLSEDDPEPDISNCESVDLMEYLRSQLGEGEQAVIVEAGNEKLRYVGGVVCAVCENGVEYCSTGQMGEMLIRQMNRGTFEKVEDDE